MLEIGIGLRQTRESRGLVLAEAEAETRIRARYLAALEEKRFEALPEGYARTFLRSYANYLGLDGQLFVDEYDARFPLEQPIIPHPPPRRRREWGAPSVGTLVILAGVVVLLVLLVAGQFGAGRPTPRPTSVRAKPVQAARLHVPRVQARPAPLRPAATQAQLVLSAVRGDCWLRVRIGSVSGPVLYEKTLAQGEKISFTGRQLWIRLGAPANVDLTVNGRRAARFPDNHPRNVLVTAGGVRQVA
jgi:hypothetical protein